MRLGYSNFYPEGNDWNTGCRLKDHPVFFAATFVWQLNFMEIEQRHKTWTAVVF